MDTESHWEEVYSSKEPEAVSWYRAHLETPVALVERVSVSRLNACAHFVPSLQPADQRHWSGTLAERGAITKPSLA